MIKQQVYIVYADNDDSIRVKSFDDPKIHYEFKKQSVIIAVDELETANKSWILEFKSKEK